MGWRLDLNKLTPPACAAQHVYYCGNRNDLDRVTVSLFAFYFNFLTSDLTNSETVAATL